MSHAKEAKILPYFASVWKCGNTVQTRKGRPLGVFELEPKDLIKENYLTKLKKLCCIKTEIKQGTEVR